MPGSRTARRAVGAIVVILLLTLLAAPPAHARSVDSFRPDSFLDWLWRALARLSSWAKEGGMMDPDGQPHAAPPPGDAAGQGG